MAEIGKPIDRIDGRAKVTGAAKYEEGKLKTHIETVLPLTEVKKVHQLSQSGRTRGKIVLQVEA